MDWRRRQRRVRVCQFGELGIGVVEGGFHAGLGFTQTRLIPAHALQLTRHTATAAAKQAPAQPRPTTAIAFGPLLLVQLVQPPFCRLLNSQVEDAPLPPHFDDSLDLALHLLARTLVRQGGGITDQGLEGELEVGLAPRARLLDDFVGEVDQVEPFGGVGVGEA